MKIKKLVLSILLSLCIIFSLSVSAFATESEEAPKYDITINIVPEKGWLVNNSTVKIKVIDNKNTGTFQISKVEAKIGADGVFEDVTDSMSIEVSEKCAVYVLVTDAYGTQYSQTRYIDGYDTTPPTFNVAVNNGVMVVDTNDNESGVEAIYINGYKYKPNKQGKLTVRLQKFDASYTNFSVYVVDSSGNESEAYVIDNPYYNQPAEGEEENTGNPANSLPESGEAADKEESSAEILDVTDEDGNDISEEVASKQFYTIATKDGQTYYLVIDMAGGLQYGDNDYSGNSSGTVYFLTYVDNNDLLNLTSSDEVTLGYNSVAAGNNIDETATSDNPDPNSENADSTEEGDVPPEQQEPQESDPTVFVVIFIVVILFVVIIAKSKSSSKSRTPQNEFGDYEDDEEYYNEQESSSLNELNEDEE